MDDSENGTIEELATTSERAEVRATYAELVPREWLEEAETWIWASCYHAMRLPRAALENAPRQIRFPDALALLYYGSPLYHPKPSIQIRNGQFFVETTQGPKQGPEGSYLTLVLRYQPSIESDYDARVRELTLRSLITLVHGDNIAYEQLFQSAERLDAPQSSFFADAIRNPATLGGPDISDERLGLTSQIWTSVESLDEHEKNRVKLSLRWNGKARSADSIDEFISRWVALEALGMSDRNNIRPLEEALAKAYGVEYNLARTKYGLGRLFGFRSRILHHGFLPSIHAHLLDYLQALYKDILWAKLQIPGERAAEQVLETKHLNLEQLLQES